MNLCLFDYEKCLIFHLKHFPFRVLDVYTASLPGSNCLDLNQASLRKSCNLEG